MKSRLNINPHYMLGNIEEISRYNIIVGGRGNNMNRKVKVVEKPEIMEGKKMSNKVKRFKNVHKLSFEELIVYLKSTRMAGTISEFDCFLSNYKDNSICIHGRCCGMSCICDMINEELIKLDNLSTATEIEEALKPVYLYREELKRAEKKEKIDYSADCNMNDEDTNNNCLGCSRFCFPIGCMVGEDSEGRVKIKVVEKPEIVVRGTIERPYFEIKYKEVGNDKYNVGYGSYFLDKVFRWREEEFEISEVK